MLQEASSNAHRANDVNEKCSAKVGVVSFKNDIINLSGRSHQRDRVRINHKDKLRSH